MNANYFPSALVKDSFVAQSYEVQTANDGQKGLDALLSNRDHS
jgi:hypothetical protein